MKKIILVILVSFFILVGCRPKNVRDIVYKGGLKTLEVIDSYLDYEIEADKAYDELVNISDRLNEIQNLSSNEVIITVNISILRADMLFKKIDTISERKSFSDIVDMRNELAEQLGKKKRAY